MSEVGTTVSRQRVVVDGRDGAGVDICAFNQVVDKKEEQHSERGAKRDLLPPGTLNLLYPK